MPSISHNQKNENEISDFVTKFMKEFQIGKLLFQCNAGKLKGIPVIDDSLFDRSRSGKTELLAKVVDHCSMKYKRGFCMLTLGWSDGNSFIPVNHCLLSAADDKNLLCDAENFDGRSKYLLSIEGTVGHDAFRCTKKE